MSESQLNLRINFNSFADWCKHKDSLSESARHTVEMLLEKAGTSDCDEAGQVLSNLSRLNLYNNQITDITPLSGLTNLTALDLNNNQIADITPLSALTKLTYLTLENNQITDLNLSSELIANSTERVDRTRAAAAIEFAYAALGKTSPKIIIFCKSPQAAITELNKSKFVIETADFCQYYKQLESGCRPFNLIIERPNLSKLMRWESQLEQEVGVHFSDYRNDSRWLFTRKYLLGKICVADFCVSVLKIVLNLDAQKAWECLKQLLTECGWILMFEKICYVCDRPIKLSLDSEYNLHAEGASAIEFPDGY